MAILVSDLLKKLDAVPMSVIEDIKAEIEDLEPIYNFEGFYACQSKVLAIIDKHCGKGTDE